MGCFIYNILYLSPVEAIKQKSISDSQKTKKGEIEDTTTENHQFLKVSINRGKKEQLNYKTARKQ